MQAVRIAREFDSWRTAARGLLARDLPPEQIVWAENDSVTMFPEIELSTDEPVQTKNVPAEFVSLARLVACFRDPERWSLLYRILWRLTHGERRLLQDATDDDTHRFFGMHRRVRLDRHKMTAFVRFREVQSNDAEEPYYVAWHRPDHFIVRLTAPFFQRRFASMKWSILTPDECVHWAGGELRFTEGVPASAAPASDELEILWRTYYANIFNPARLNLKMMRREMPARHWPTLPETQTLDDLVRDAPRRVRDMVNRCAKLSTSTGSATEFLPSRITLPQLRESIKTCHGCDLYCHATQPVFGEGPQNARIMFVGEQPGDQEDLVGRPFVGPAGQLLDAVMQEVGIPREEVYITNAVKHFKFELRGTRRIHSRPSAREVNACKTWIESELLLIRPQVVVCLGSTAAQQLLGREFRVTRFRGQWMKTDFAPRVLATIHPSAILRTPGEQSRTESRRLFAEDLQKVAKELEMCSSRAMKPDSCITRCATTQRSK
ncbi:MAG TPA: UdgX family uracil-DNA binding protein [Tepidisphaeraceae bacterium]|jgi:DNA polymerase|nr:UdgX family uracil-DNA binding protein [Tepidisphaeraceae bacterium]